MEPLWNVIFSTALKWINLPNEANIICFFYINSWHICIEIHIYAPSVIHTCTCMYRNACMYVLKYLYILLNKMKCTMYIYIENSFKMWVLSNFIWIFCYYFYSHRESHLAITQIHFTCVVLYESTELLCCTIKW